MTCVQLALIHAEIRAANDPAAREELRAQLTEYGGAYLLAFTVLDRCYHMNNVALLGHTWVKYLGDAHWHPDGVRRSYPRHRQLQRRAVDHESEAGRT